MKKKDLLWNKFIKTGRVQDYILYCDTAITDGNEAVKGDTEE